MGYLPFIFPQVRLKTTLTLVTCGSLLLIPQQKETIPKMLDVPNIFNKHLKSCPSASKKAGSMVWNEQDWTKHEFYMDEFLIISS